LENNMADGYVDQDGDTVRVWKGKSKDPGIISLEDQDINDKDNSVGALKSKSTGQEDPAYQAWLKENEILSKPSISISAQKEVIADINAEFQLAFGQNAPKKIAQAYFNEIRALQSSRVTGGTKSGSKVNVNVQGVSAQEIRTILQKYIAAAAGDKIAAAATGDPKAVAALSRGNFGLTYTTLKNAYAENGIPTNPKSLGKMVADSLSNPDKLKANLNLINLQAKTYFPALADKIDNGYTVKQLLTPYINARANILEEDPDTIDIKNLSNVAKDSKGLMSLYEYEISLRSDPKWRFTKNAQDSLGALARDMTKMFGLGA
jgi:hypothetical protein